LLLRRRIVAVTKTLLKGILVMGIAVTLFIHADLLWSWDTAKPDEAAPTEAKDDQKPEAKPDPTGGKTGDVSSAGEVSKIPEIEVSKKDPDAKDVVFNQAVKTIGNEIGKNRVGINMLWTLLTGFLVMFMQTGFAMVETGLTRAKNVAHTMAMNIGIYAIGMLGFWLCGFAFMFGNYGPISLFGGGELLNKGFSLSIGGKTWGLIGYEGFFLAGRAFDTGVMTLFLFQMVFMDTAATIPTGAMAERWKFLSFALYGFGISAIIYPIYGNWVWGGGWLAKLGANYGLGHGHVDFAGSSVVHMVGGVTALVGAWMLGPRIGKYNKDGTPNVLPAHNVPMYVVGTLILAFGWFGFNPGSTNAGTDLNIGRIAANTMLASAAGAFSASLYVWLVFKKPDPSFLCNGLLSGLVAITAPCAFVAPWAAVLIGLLAGLFVVWGCLFVERVLKVDDPVGAVGVHGINGAWGVLALGLFADGTYNAGMNGSFWYKMKDGSLKWFAEELKELPDGVLEPQGVTGLFYGNPSQFVAECIGVVANVVWVGLAAYLMFWLLNKLVGNRVNPEVEVQGLDVPELGVLGYVSEDPKTPEGHVSHPPKEPHRASAPPNGQRFTVVVEGLEPRLLRELWSDLCQPGEQPPLEDFRAVYPYLTTLEGKTFTFRGGDPEAMRDALARLLRRNVRGVAVGARVDRLSEHNNQSIPSLT
jgi:Amt family ammonium transporter